VKQFVQVVGPALASPDFDPPGLGGREGAAELKPDSGGELGDDCGRWCIPEACARPAALGVELVRGIFCRLGSFPRLRMSLTEAAEPCVRLRLPLDPQSCGDGTISVDPMVTVLRGGPPGYLAGVGLNWLERLVSHWKPALKSNVGSSMGEYSGGIVKVLSGKDPTSSSSLSDSIPKVNIRSFRGTCMPGDRDVAIKSACKTCEGSTCPDGLYIGAPKEGIELGAVTALKMDSLFGLKMYCGCMEEDMSG